MRVLRWLLSFVRRCPRGRCHRWGPFQVRWRSRCDRCGLIRDHLTVKEWASWDDYIRAKGITIEV